jgi:hypothetical protein
MIEIIGYDEQCDKTHQFGVWVVPLLGVGGRDKPRIAQIARIFFF